MCLWKTFHLCRKVWITRERDFIFGMHILLMKQTPSSLSFIVTFTFKIATWTFLWQCVFSFHKQILLSLLCVLSILFCCLNSYSETPVYLKGHRHDWWSLFTISSFPKLLYISSMKSSENRTTIFKLIVLGIELHAAFEERENKQKNAKF